MKNGQAWLEWTSTVCIVIGAVLASLEISPLNLVFSLAGNLGWGIAGWLLKKPSLWTISVGLTFVYLGGIIFLS